ncbi:GGDEF domain-containing protein [Shewanella gelidii]|uniref:diguanylate cyclase n=1 Tax=Shewanella gelidii TaxID=1642821 RepID=A0A917JJS1_9GAMM|nr:GGDEF domain-containing protein [Shewanella gelidii]MCL1096686.1 GGDEF domain-containing protein [Shewanella gelidii]GGI69492.1 hypothetical protein GCM10009332_03210 [Shewanella gelidii]
MRQYIIQFIIGLLLLVSAVASAHVSLTDSNRLLPIDTLYEPAHAKQITALNQYLLKNHPDNYKSDIKWHVLHIQSHSKAPQSWVLTRPTHKNSAPTLYLKSLNNSEGFMSIQPNKQEWPINSYHYTIDIENQAILELFVPYIKQAPTQIWNQAWWSQYAEDKSSHLSFAWGVLLTVLILQICLLLTFPLLPKSILFITGLSMIVLGQQLGLAHTWFNIPSPLTLWPVLITVSQMMLLQLLMPLFDKKVPSHYITVTKGLTLITLILALAYIAIGNDKLGAATLLGLILNTFVQAILVLYSLKKRYQSGYFPVLGLYVSMALLALALAQYTQVTQVNQLYAPVIAIATFGMILALLLIYDQISELDLADSGLAAHSQPKAAFAKRANKPSKSQKLQKQLQELEAEHRLLQEKNAIDFLTGLKNRQFFDEKYRNELAISARENKPLGLILIDLDHFKKVNDEYGHQVGDEILKAVAKRFYFALKRPADSICRYGGEEFAVLLPNTNLIGAAHIAKSISDTIKEKPFKTSKGEIRVTLSQGVASFVHDLSCSESHLIESADKVLYQAKSEGRDKIQLAPSKPYLVKAQ